MTTIEDLKLTRPEKAALVAGLCMVETDIAPTMKNVTYFTVEFMRETLRYPGMTDFISLVAGSATVQSLTEKAGLNDT